MSGDGPSGRHPYRSLRLIVGTLIGLGFVVFLFAKHDFGAVLQAASLAGYGFLLVVLWRGTSLLAATAGWRLLMRPIERPGLARLWLARWIGEAVNSMLPVAQIGGDVVRTRLAHRIPLPDGGRLAGISAAASVIIDMTVALTAQSLFALPGLWRIASLPEVSLWKLSASLAVTALPLLLLLGAQRGRVLKGGAALADRMGLARFLGPPHLIGDGLRRRIAATYRRWPSLLAALLWHLGAWVCRAGEVWLILRLMGQPIDWLDAVTIEGLTNAARTAAFLLPAGLGVQEGALILVCGWLGIPPPMALALALLKRARELAVGLLGLGAWLMVEHGALRRTFRHQT
jgi:putative membrane protein